MKNIIAHVALLAALSAVPDTAEAGSTVRASLAYTRGTEALERGDYEAAAGHLLEAVNLDPSLSRNHTNYSAALFELGRYTEGWPHARKGVLLDPKNVQAQNNSRRYIKRLLLEANLNIGAALREVVAVLGEPDRTAQQGDCTWHQYGITALCFRAGLLSEIGDMQWKPHR